MYKKKLKPYHGILTMLLMAVLLFVVQPILLGGMGLWGSFLGELSFLLLAVLVTVAARADVREVFPVHKLHGFTVFGTLLMWGATFAVVMAMTMLLSYFFPEQVYQAGAGISEEMLSSTFLPAFLVVSISPAICEEAVFRGVFLNSLSGVRKKWLVIVLVGCVFGAFHGSVWRFLPTAALGMLMTYLVLETNNMVYSVLLHMVNNLVPVLLLFGLQKIMGAVETGAAMEAVSGQQIPLASVAIYVFMAASAPFVFYIGKYFVRRGEKGYKGEIFHRDNKKVLIFLCVLTGCLILASMLLLVISLFTDRAILQEILQETGGIY